MTKIVNVKTEAKVVIQNDSEALLKKYGTKSGAIRALNSEGKSRSEISKMLGVRYQHVRNVLITPIKKAKEMKVSEVSLKQVSEMGAE
jgi:hypothetical protein